MPALKGKKLDKKRPGEGQGRGILGTKRASQKRKGKEAKASEGKKKGEDDERRRRRRQETATTKTTITMTRENRQEGGS